MSNIVIPTQDHQIKALETQSKNKKEDGKDLSNIVLPTQEHQFKLFEQGSGNKKDTPAGSSAGVSNIVIPNQEQMKLFETSTTKETKPEDVSHTQQFTTSVFDLLNSSKSSIFSKYVREFKDLSKKLDTDSAQLIVFAPTDTAIESLPLKPWEFPLQVTSRNDERGDVSQGNIKNFLESHVVDSSTDFEKLFQSKGAELITVNGDKLQLVNDNDEFKVAVDGKPVATVNNVQIVGNGALLTIDSPLQWPGK